MRGDALQGRSAYAATLAVLDRIREGTQTAEPGSFRRTRLAVDDIGTAREDLVHVGAEVSEVFHLEGGRVPGPDPEGRSYQTYASLSDPDGNEWLLQEIKTRLPGREWEDWTDAGLTCGTERNDMTDITSKISDGVPTYLGSGDPALTDYYPAWVGNLADDVTIEGSLLDGAAQGAEAARTIVGTIRTLYEAQEFHFAGPYGHNGFLEVYTAQVHGEPIGCVVLITYNDAGQTQHIAANYRPLSSLLLLSRLVGEKLAGTPNAKYFLASKA